MSKTLCKTLLVEEPSKVKYTCKKCGAQAKKEKHLCKPKKLITSRS
jgi:hypothetical protein